MLKNERYPLPPLSHRKMREGTKRSLLVLSTNGQAEETKWSSLQRYSIRTTPIPFSFSTLVPNRLDRSTALSNTCCASSVSGSHCGRPSWERRPVEIFVSG